MDERPWWDERFPSDAPSYTAEEANGWAAGWNACVREYERQLNEALRKEMP